MNYSSVLARFVQFSVVLAACCLRWRNVLERGLSTTSLNWFLAPIAVTCSVEICNKPFDSLSNSHQMYRQYPLITTKHKNHWQNLPISVLFSHMWSLCVSLAKQCNLRYSWFLLCKCAPYASVFNDVSSKKNERGDECFDIATIVNVLLTAWR